MKIDWLGHCCFRLTESTGTTIVTDPFDPAAIGCNMPRVQADAVTCSHKHPNHSNVGAVGGNPIVLDTLGSFEIKGAHINSIRTHRTHGDENLVFRYRLDGVDLCHLGDIAEPCNPELVDLIGPIDVLFLPIGGSGYTIDAETAYDYVDLLMPEIVIPMHYQTDEYDNDLDLDTLKEFLKLFDDDAIAELEEGQQLEFERDDFTSQRIRVVIPTLLTK